jgi:hypothetical protein
MAFATPGAQALASSPTEASACGPLARASAYPTLCSIPLTPTDVRNASAFKAAVVETRQAGRRLVVKNRDETSSLPLAGAESFGAAARAQAAPPPSADGSASSDTQTFEAEARRKAEPPRRPHS